MQPFCTPGRREWPGDVRLIILSFIHFTHQEGEGTFHTL